MSSCSTVRRDDAWLRFVRGLVVVLVAMLERRIARLIHKYEYAPDGSCDFAALDRKISRLEDLRDAYVAWLADPEATAVVRAGGAPFRRPVLVRARGRSRGRSVAAVARAGRARCRCALSPQKTAERAAMTRGRMSAEPNPNE